MHALPDRRKATGEELAQGVDRGPCDGGSGLRPAAEVMRAVDGTVGGVADDVLGVDVHGVSFRDVLHEDRKGPRPALEDDLEKPLRSA